MRVCVVCGVCVRLRTMTLLLSLTAFGGFHPAGGAGAGAGAVGGGSRVSAVAGGEAALPCDVSAQLSSDKATLVVWYREDKPIYSFDSREVGARAHWAETALGGRARWLPPPSAALTLRSLRPSDAGHYRCRVDYQLSPTRNYDVTLDVIELPGKPVIFDEFGKQVGETAGPYYEGGGLKLTCVVEGGKPAPRVRWWQDDKVVSTLVPSESQPSRALQLRVQNLTRAHLHAAFTCSAENTPLAPPHRTNINIDLYLRPLLVEILSRELPLSVGRRADISCRAVGARPTANITWWLDGAQLTTVEPQKHSEDGNETVSVVRLMPTLAHNGQVLTCRASHFKLDRSTIDTALPLNIHYVPIVTLQLGSKLNPNDIEEGDDVYFECIVSANPPAYKVVWEHNGNAMQHNQRAGVIAGAAHLALQSVSRRQAGPYVCTASNVEGDGSSQPVTLQVIYKPQCRGRLGVGGTVGAGVVVGAALHEAARVLCEVDAHPPPKTFHWTLNNSAGSIDIDPSKYTLDATRGRSVLTYTPRSESEYGTLTCRATNLVGVQAVPCTFTLLPAARPEPPRNCSAVNLTDDAVHVHCDPGYDGGLLCKFVAEAWVSSMVVANQSQAIPSWKLQGLGASKTVRLVLYAANAKGRSDPVMMKLHTPTRQVPHTEAQDGSRWDVGWAIGGAVGAVGALGAMACLALLAAKLRHHAHAHYTANLQSGKTYKSSLQSSRPSLLTADDKNPDVIPLNKGHESSAHICEGPEPPPYAAVARNSVGSSRSTHSLQRPHSFEPHERREEPRVKTPHTPHTPLSDVQSIGALSEDRRLSSSATNTLRTRRDVVTTRTPLLASAHQESCV